MIRRKHNLQVLLVGSMLATTGGVAAADTTKEPLSNAAAKGVRVSAVLPQLGVAPSKVRIAALVTPNFRTDPLVRGKGVASVTHPSTGVFCIKPLVSVDVQTLVPVVSVEWGRSSGNANLVQYAGANINCPTDRIEIFTFSPGAVTSRFEFSDFVAFTIVVP